MSLITKKNIRENNNENLYRFKSHLLDLKKCILRSAVKIFIYSVILGQLEPFRNYKGFEYDFPEILDAI